MNLAQLAVERPTFYAHLLELPLVIEKASGVRVELLDVADVTRTGINLILAVDGYNPEAMERVTALVMDNGDKIIREPYLDNGKTVLVYRMGMESSDNPNFMIPMEATPAPLQALAPMIEMMLSHYAGCAVIMLGVLPAYKVPTHTVASEGNRLLEYMNLEAHLVAAGDTVVKTATFNGSVTMMTFSMKDHS